MCTLSPLLAYLEPVTCHSAASRQTGIGQPGGVAEQSDVGYVPRNVVGNVPWEMEVFRDVPREVSEVILTCDTAMPHARGVRVRGKSVSEKTRPAAKSVWRTLFVHFERRCLRTDTINKTLTLNITQASSRPVHKVHAHAHTHTDLFMLIEPRLL